MASIFELILDRMKSNPDVILGIADVRDSDYSDRYRRALVLAVPHEESISLRNYSEERFEKAIGIARERADRIVLDLSGLFQEYNIEYCIPPAAQTDEESLIAPFSFKFAAVKAGIGWIGKNGVLVTEQYGPRVRLAAVLVKCNLPMGTPVTRSLCDDACFLCVNACPYKALKGIQWDMDKRRDELIDYRLCNAKRSLYIKDHNRKNACGLCMAACPVGLGR